LSIYLLTFRSSRLDGELPGVHQGDIDIEFIDNITLSIKGHTTRAPRQAIHANIKKGTVEDVDTKCATTANQGTTATATRLEEAATADVVSGAECATAAMVAEAVDKSINEPKHLISERTLGDFERKFTFPGRVDQDGVRASMKYGILTIIVPKTVRRKIVVT